LVDRPNLLRSIFSPLAASDDELEWIKYGRKLHQDSPDIIDGQARAIVALASTLLTVYTGVLVLYKIPDIFGSFLPTVQGIWGIRLVILVCPMVFWILSIYFNLDVYQPEAIKQDPFPPTESK
jgi:hypothetical protein